MSGRRIAYAYFDPAWDKATMSITTLNRTEISPLEYLAEMKGSLHCPSCYEPLTRVPSDPAMSIMADMKEALFRHLPDKDHTAPYCLLRSGIMSGKKYNSEEEALQAVEDGDIIVISGFMQERANNNVREDEEGDENQVETYFESEDGAPLNVPVSRHEGQTFTVPGRVTSVMSLCANFRRNYYRDIHIAIGDEVKHYTLSECLTEAAEIVEENVVPNFYFGVIESVGAGYWSQNKKWGEIALLPQKYEDFLRANYKSE